MAVQLGGGEGLAVEAIEPVDHSQLTVQIVGCIWCRLECILPKKTLVAAVIFFVIKVEGIKVLSSKIDILHGMRRVFIF